MRFSLPFALLSSTILLAGCQSLSTGSSENSSYPEPAQGQDPIDYAIAYTAADGTAMGSSEKTIADSVETTDTYRRLNFSFCSGKKFHRNVKSFRPQMDKICANKGGSVQENQKGITWCRSDKTHAPLFAYERWNAPDHPCYVPGVIHCRHEVVTPLPTLPPTNKKWVEYAESRGFVSDRIQAKRDAEIQAERKRREAAWDRAVKLEKERQRLAQARKAWDVEQMLKTRGLRICRKDSTAQSSKYPNAEGYPYYEGFIEDIAAPRIKIQVTAYITKRYPLYELQYSTVNQIIWDRPENWYICE